MPGSVVLVDYADAADWAVVAGSTGLPESSSMPTRYRSTSRHPALEAAARCLTGQIPTHLMATLFVPAACLSFTVGILLAMLNLPQGFDYGMCVLSRLCSRYHNPQGHGFLTFGMIALPAFLIPLPGWLSHRLGGCPRLMAWGRVMLSIGLVATALVGAERAWYPTHWTPLEVAHLVLAGIAFAGLWLGLAMLIGASDACDGVRVPWRWLYRPPWYLAASILPIVVLFAIYVPFRTIPQAHSSLLSAWPPPFRFLRTVSFWQGYLVVGLVISLIGATLRACGSDSKGDSGSVSVQAPTRRLAFGTAGSRPGRGSILYFDRRHAAVRPPHDHAGQPGREPAQTRQSA